MAWGSHRAGDSVLDELRARTWDSQRMAALGPWSMAWGKLFGATVIPWFAGLLSLTVYAIARQDLAALELLQVVVTCITGAILFQSLSLIGALVCTRSDRYAKSTLTSWAALGALALLWIYFSNYYRSSDDIKWYGNTYDRFDFLTVSSLTLTAWIAFGAYRMMCVELAIATRPWAWIAFTMYLTIYFTGGTVASATPLAQSVGLFAAMGLAVCGGGTYITAFALYRDPLTFRRLITYAQARRWRRVLEETPIWMASLTMAAIFMVACVALNAAPPYSLERLGLSAIVLWMLALRDVAVLYYFSYGKLNKRVETSTVISLAMVYWFVPSILESIDLLKVSWLFRPPMWDRPILSSVIIGLHLLIIGVLIYQRYRHRIAPARGLS